MNYVILGEIWKGDCFFPLKYGSVPVQGTSHIFPKVSWENFIFFPLSSIVHTPSVFMNFVENSSIARGTKALLNAVSKRYSIPYSIRISSSSLNWTFLAYSRSTQNPKTYLESHRSTLFLEEEVAVPLEGIGVACSSPSTNSWVSYSWSYAIGFLRLILFLGDSNFCSTSIGVSWGFFFLGLWKERRGFRLRGFGSYCFGKSWIKWGFGHLVKKYWGFMWWSEVWRRWLMVKMNRLKELGFGRKKEKKQDSCNNNRRVTCGKLKR